MRKNYILLRTLIVLVVMSATAVTTVNAQNVGDTFTSGKLKYEITSLSPKKVKVIANDPRPTGNITIPTAVNGYKITTIGQNAFLYCSGLKSIIIPTSVTTIEDGAFFESGLTSITIPNSVTELRESTFEYCPDLENVVIGNGVTTIPDRIFYQCPALKTVTLGNAVTKIGDMAFYHCENLMTANIPTTIENIGEHAFENCFKLGGTLNFPNIKTIGKLAFYSCKKISSVTLGNSITSIKNGTFTNCIGLTSVTLGESVNIIEEQAFRLCEGLSEITLPASISYLGYKAFAGCNFSTITCNMENVNNVSGSENAFYGGGIFNVPLYVPLGTVETYKGHYIFKNFTKIYPTVKVGDKFKKGDWYYQITSLSPNRVKVVPQNETSPYYDNSEKPTGNIFIGGSCQYYDKSYIVNAIGDYALYDCDDLQQIHISRTVISIGNNVFAESENIYQIKVDSENPVYSDKDNVLFNKTKTELVACPNAKLGSYVIPSSVTKIKSTAFKGCKKLTAITIPNSVTSIGNEAFGNCSGLNSLISQKENVNDIAIGNNIFIGIDKTKCALVVPTGKTTDYDNAPQWEDFNVIIGEGDAKVGDVFIIDKIKYKITSLSPREVKVIKNTEEVTGEVIIPEKPNYLGHDYTVTKIEADAFRSFSGLTSITLPNSVKTIGNRAFKECNTLTTVILGNSITTIGKSAFGKCEKLISIDIPNSVKTIGYGVFRECNTLTTVTLGNSITTIAEEAFAECENLTSIDIPNSVQSIEPGAFDNCRALTTVNMGNSITNIGAFAFKSCYSLSSIIIPNSVQSIGYSAFIYCLELKSATIGSAVTKIEGGAFYNCANLVSLTSKIEDVNSVVMGDDVFHGVDKNVCTLYVPVGKKGEYEIADHWKDFSPNIVESVLGDEFEVAPLKYKVTSLAPREVKVIANNPKPTGDITIPATVTYDGETYNVTAIGDIAFHQCIGLTSVIIGENVTTIGEYAFYGCNVTSATIGENVTEIKEGAFWGCNFTSVTIPNSVTTIGGAAFTECEDLVSVTIGKNVTFIGEEAFSEVYSLTSITALMENISDVEMGDDVFNGVFKNECILNVPVGKVNEYRNAEQWKDFITIQNVNTGIGNTTILTNPISVIGNHITISQVAGKNVKLYNLSGQVLYNLNATQDNITLSVNKAGAYVLQVGNATRVVKL